MSEICCEMDDLISLIYRYFGVCPQCKGGKKLDSAYTNTNTVSCGGCTGTGKYPDPTRPALHEQYKLSFDASLRESGLNISQIDDIARAGFIAVGRYMKLDKVLEGKV